MSLKLSREGSSSRGTCDNVCRAKGWTWGGWSQPGPNRSSLVRFLRMEHTLLHSRSGLQPVLSVWSEQPSLGLLRGFAGLWGNGVRSPLAAFLPLTLHIAGVCGSLSAGALGPPCRTGPKPARAHPHRCEPGMHSHEETIVSPRGS